ncbi:MAG: hypothetical protein KJ583_02365 [Nanoarchaeota archaeon]|nr:hypothetical protein [Nanoarchaeota archaeon]MBU1604139.1 hypothetical protein [Nanoarchaeota archaeon]MBU2443122.1 hypothetical protein [Nanoarchaeota archaeon]
MPEQLFFEEEEELKRIRSCNSRKKDINDLNRKDLTKNEMDEIFCSN